MCGGVALAEISFNFDDPGAQVRAVFVSPHQDLPEKLARNLTGLSSEKIPGKRTKRRHAESLVRTDPAHLPWHVGQPPAGPLERSSTIVPRAAQPARLSVPVRHCSRGQIGLGSVLRA